MKFYDKIFKKNSRDINLEKKELIGIFIAFINIVFLISNVLVVIHN